MINRKRLYILGFLLTTTVSFLWGFSLESLSVQGIYTLGTPKDTLIDAAGGPGFEVSLKWKLSDRWSLQLKSEHGYLSIEQENAHRVLDWPYWQQIYGNVIYQAENDPIYDVTVEPHQDLKIKPVEAGLMWSFAEMSSFRFGAGVTGGITWFSRQLYIEEFWKKHFSSIDYTYSYDFQNRSDAETGWLWSFTPEAVIQYQPSDNVSFSLTGAWKRYMKSSSENSDFFPLKHHYSFEAGVHFLY